MRTRPSNLDDYLVLTEKPQSSLRNVMSHCTHRVSTSCGRILCLNLECYAHIFLLVRPPKFDSSVETLLPLLLKVKKVRSRFIFIWYKYGINNSIYIKSHTLIRTGLILYFTKNIRRSFNAACIEKVESAPMSKDCWLLYFFPLKVLTLSKIWCCFGLRVLLTRFTERVG